MSQNETSQPKNKPSVYACPNCRKKIIWSETPTRPFCSERCKMIDFGDWASEKHTIPVVEHDEFND